MLHILLSTLLFAQTPTTSNPALPRHTPLPLSTAADSATIRLDGTWSFQPNPPADFATHTADTSPDNRWKPIEVPGEWAMQGFEVKAATSQPAASQPDNATTLNAPSAAYRRALQIPPAWADRRILLQCDAIYSDATVFINGSRAGRHIGGFTPFELDITPLAKVGKTNTIAIEVRSESVADILSHGSRYAMHDLGGITRSIRLVAVPPLHVSLLHVTTMLDDTYRDAVAHVQLALTNSEKRDTRQLSARFTIAPWSPTEKAAPIATLEQPLADVQPDNTTQASIRIPVPAPKLWDCEHPNLYVLTCELRRDGSAIETVQRRFGFRTVEIRGPEIVINGRPVKLRGLNRHESHPLRGRSLTGDLWRRDAQLMRDANVNYVRTSHYPPAEAFIDACDELGLFVGEEAPFCFVGMTWGNKLWEKENPHDPKYREPIVRQTLEMLARDLSHPSIILWSLANESLWGANFEASARAVEALDPSRPREFSRLPWETFLTMPEEAFCQVSADHYPGPKGPDKFGDRGRPMLFDEYCHLNAYCHGEIETDPGVREEWARVFERMWERMYAARGIAGGSLWAGISDRVLLPNGKTAGHDWGPIDGWRRPQPEWWTVKKVYSPVHIDDTQKLRVPEPGRPALIRVHNRHDFTDLKELRIEWAIESHAGTLKASLSPRHIGVLPIPLPEEVLPLAGKTLALRFTSPRGFLVDEYRLAFEVPLDPTWSVEPGRRLHQGERVENGSGWIATDGPRPRHELPPQPSPQLLTHDDRFEIRTDQSTWEIHRTTGQILAARRRGTLVLTGGPTLMMLPLALDDTNVPAFSEKGLLNRTCTQWKADKVEAHTLPGEVQIHVMGEYAQAAGGYTLRIDSWGELQLWYFFKSKMAMNPRQLGMILDLPASFDSLEWSRCARFSVYPPDHIGRPEGIARAHRNDPRSRQQPAAQDQPSWPEQIGPRDEPPWPWSLDENALGTRDFRASRTEFASASLFDASGAACHIIGNGRQGLRCWLDGNRVRVLVAEFSRASGEPYINRWGRHYDDDHRPLLKDSVIEDTIRVELTTRDPAKTTP